MGVARGVAGRVAGGQEGARNEGLLPVRQSGPQRLVPGRRQDLEECRIVDGEDRLVAVLGRLLEPIPSGLGQGAFDLDHPARHLVAGDGTPTFDLDQAIVGEMGIRSDDWDRHGRLGVYG